MLFCKLANNMEKHKEKWDRLDRIHVRAADILISSLITQDEYNQLACLADLLTNTPVDCLLRGKLISDHNEESLNDNNEAESLNK